MNIKKRAFLIKLKKHLVNKILIANDIGYKLMSFVLFAFFIIYKGKYLILYFKGIQA